MVCDTQKLEKWHKIDGLSTSNVKRIFLDMKYEEVKLSVWINLWNSLCTWTLMNRDKIYKYTKWWEQWWNVLFV